MTRLKKSTLFALELVSVLALNTIFISTSYAAAKSIGRTETVKASEVKPNNLSHVSTYETGVPSEILQLVSSLNEIKTEPYHFRKIESSSIISIDPLSGDQRGNSDTYKVKLKNGPIGYFKHADDGLYRNDYKHEIAAYKLDQLLGFSLVPETIGVELFLPNKNKIVRGSLQVHSEGISAYDKYGRGGWSIKSPPLKFFDFLIGNCDRHGKNYLIHDGKEVAIDNGSAFASTVCSIRYKERPQVVTLLARMDQEIPRKILQNLKGLSNEVLRSELSLLNDLEFARFLMRKNYALFRFAIDRGDVSDVDAMIAAGTLINTPESYGETPLYFAIAKGNAEIVQKLIDAGAYFNKFEDDGSTPLYHAASMGYTDIVQKLIDAGADLNRVSRNGSTPLDIAKKNSHLQVVEILNRSEKGRLFKAINRGDFEAANRLINDRVDLNKPNTDGYTPLCFAASHGNIKLLQSLIKAGADINKGNYIDGSTPLAHAVKNGQAEVAQKLIDAKADLNKSDNDGDTPLCVAAYNGHAEVVQKLIDAKADLNKSDNDGDTPLYVATYNGHAEVVQKLIDAKADLNKSNNDGFTPLHIAAYLGDVEIVQKLINAGADINKKSDKGLTPLEEAKRKNRMKVVEIFDVSRNKPVTTH